MLFVVCHHEGWETTDEPCWWCSGAGVISLISLLQFLCRRSAR